MCSCPATRVSTRRAGAPAPLLLFPPDYPRDHAPSLCLCRCAHTPAPSTLCWASREGCSRVSRDVFVPHKCGAHMHLHWPEGPSPAPTCAGVRSCAPPALSVRPCGVCGRYSGDRWAAGGGGKETGREGWGGLSLSLPSPLIDCCPHSLRGKVHLFPFTCIYGTSSLNSVIKSSLSFHGE